MRPEATPTIFASVVFTENLHNLIARQVKVVTNAGGVNPLALREKLQTIASRAGAHLKIAVVLGDDLKPQERKLRERGSTEMFSGKPMPASFVSTPIWVQSPLPKR